MGSRSAKKPTSNIECFAPVVNVKVNVNEYIVDDDVVSGLNFNEIYSE